jgi:uncharacterized MAPEG superfamily protein
MRHIATVGKLNQLPSSKFRRIRQMPIELKILGYAALLQVIQFFVMAVPVNLQLGVKYTGGSRDEPQQATGMAGRLKRALENHFEGLILFTIAVLVVVLGESSSDMTEKCAWAYLWARILYVPAYASGIYLLRSLIWSVGFAATALMLIAALT